jgi:hypothetical protein
MQIARFIGLLALVATLAAPLLFAAGTIAAEPMKTALLVATAAWFMTAPLWMKGGH